MLVFTATNLLNNETFSSADSYKVTYFVRQQMQPTSAEYLQLVGICKKLRDNYYSDETHSTTFKDSMRISVAEAYVENFVAAHPNLHDVKNIAVNGTAYKKLAGDGSIMEYWQRDDDGYWHDVTDIAKQQEQEAKARKHKANNLDEDIDE